MYFIGRPSSVGAVALPLLAQLGCEILAEILRFEDLADLDLAVLAMRVGAALDPFDRLLQRLALPEPEAGDQFLRLGERPVDHGPLFAGELTRAPLELGCKPSPASITPALVSSSLNLPI